MDAFRNSLRTFTLCVLASAAFAQKPAQPVAKMGALIFSDDFERTGLGAWKQNCQTFAVADGVMKGSQTRAGHGAVGAIHVAFSDAVIEFKFRIEGATSINAVCDDKAWKSTHAGHICRATITPKLIRLGDDKEGGMRNDIFGMRKDPKRKAEGDKLMEGRTKTFPMAVATGSASSASTNVRANATTALPRALRRLNLASMRSRAISMLS